MKKEKKKSTQTKKLSFEMLELLFDKTFLKLLKEWAIQKWGEDRYEKRKKFVKATTMSTYIHPDPFPKKAHYVTRTYKIKGWKHHLIKYIESL